MAHFHSSRACLVPLTGYGPGAYSLSLNAKQRDEIAGKCERDIAQFWGVIED